MKKLLIFTIFLGVLASCSSAEPETPGIPEANMPNPASEYCEEQGYTVEIRSAEDSSQSGVCVFPDGSECEEWAYFHGECRPASQSESVVTPTAIPTTPPIDPNDYQSWWTYTHPDYGFSIMLPEDWKAEETGPGDPLMTGHLLNLYTEGLNIRMTFRRVGEDVLLWPTGVEAGEFVEQGSVDTAGLPASRFYFVCPNGVVNAIWYHGSENEPNIQRGDLEFGFIFTLTGFNCEDRHSLSGKLQYAGEMIIASLKVP